MALCRKCIPANLAHLVGLSKTNANANLSQAQPCFVSCHSSVQAVEVVERDLLWDGPPIRLSNKGHLRLASYLFKVRAPAHTSTRTLARMA